MNLTDALAIDVERAARITARNWSDVIDEDDAYQDIWLALLKDNYAESVAEMDSESRSSVLKKIGDHVGAQHRTDFEHFTGNYFYGTQDVREVLESGVLSGVRERTNTERLDVDEGMTLLHSRNGRYADAIRMRYQFGEPAENRKLLMRAVDALTECMNRVHENRRREHTEGPGTRPEIPNDASRRLV